LVKEDETWFLMEMEVFEGFQEMPDVFADKSVLDTSLVRGYEDIGDFMESEDQDLCQDFVIVTKD